MTAKEEIENIITAATWAENYIAEFNKNNTFDPFKCLEQKEKDYKLLSECCAFITELIETAERFRATRDRIVRE